MKFPAQTIPGFAVALAFLSFPAAVLSQGRIAGIIEEIRGPAYWRKDSQGKETKLDPARDRARILRVGEQVRSGTKGRLRLFLCSGRKDISKSSTWFTISLPNECPNQAALEELGVVGGRTRGKKTQIFSPSDHSVVWPDRFVIQWIPNAAKCTLSFAIQEVDGTELWRGNNIDSSSGRLKSDKVRKLIKQYREKVGQGPLRLRLVDSCANELFVTFSLLSLKSEASLKEDLARWNKQSGLMFHLGRAYVFGHYRIFPAVAEEYEAALKMAPESRDLLIRSIEAHRITGNYARVEELKKRLPLGTDVS